LQLCKQQHCIGKVRRLYKWKFYWLASANEAMASEVAGSSRASAGDWLCVHCTTLNKPEYVNCTSCFVRRTGAPRLKEEDLIRHSFVDRIKNLFIPNTRNCLKCPTKISADRLYCPRCASNDAVGKICAKYRQPLNDDSDSILSNFSPDHQKDSKLQTHSNSSHARKDNDCTIARTSHHRISRASSVPHETVASLEPMTDLAPSNSMAWQCTFCGVFNFTYCQNGRCYVCRIGQWPSHPSSHSLVQPALHKTETSLAHLDPLVTPPSLARNHSTPLLVPPDPFSQHPTPRTDQASSVRSTCVGPVHGASRRPRERPADLLYAPSHQLHSTSYTDQYTPSMVVKRLDDSHHANLCYQNICQYCKEVPVGKEVAERKEKERGKEWGGR